MCSTPLGSHKHLVLKICLRVVELWTDISLKIWIKISINYFSIEKCPKNGTIERMFITWHYKIILSSCCLLQIYLNTVHGPHCKHTYKTLCLKVTRPLSCYIHLVSYRWLHNMHTVKCKHPIPITYTLKNNLHVKLELYIRTIDYSRSALIILLAMYTSLKATKMVQQTDQLLILQIRWHVACWY